MTQLPSAMDYCFNWVPSQKGTIMEAVWAMM